MTNRYYYFVGQVLEDPFFDLNNTYFAALQIKEAYLTINKKAGLDVISAVPSWGQFIIKNPNEEEALLRILKGKLISLYRYRKALDRAFAEDCNHFRLSVRENKNEIYRAWKG